MTTIDTSTFSQQWIDTVARAVHLADVRQTPEAFRTVGTEYSALSPRKQADYEHFAEVTLGVLSTRLPFSTDDRVETIASHMFERHNAGVRWERPPLTGTETEEQATVARVFHAELRDYYRTMARAACDSAGALINDETSKKKIDPVEANLSSLSPSDMVTLREEALEDKHNERK